MLYKNPSHLDVAFRVVKNTENGVFSAVARAKALVRVVAGIARAFAVLSAAQNDA